MINNRSNFLKSSAGFFESSPKPDQQVEVPASPVYPQHKPGQRLI